MDELARRAIGDLGKRIDLLVNHQNQTDKRLIDIDKATRDLVEAVDRLTTIAARLAGVA